MLHAAVHMKSNEKGVLWRMDIKLLSEVKSLHTFSSSHMASCSLCEMDMLLGLNLGFQKVTKTDGHRPLSFSLERCEGMVSDAV